MFDQMYIINLALAKLSDYNTLQDLGEKSLAAFQAKAHWDVAVRGVLSEHPWDFAKKTERLSLLAEDTSLSGYDYHYSYPMDCVYVRRVFSSSQPWGNVPYSTAISFDGKQRVIQCYYADAAAEFTVANPPVTSFPIQFVSSLSWRLASEIALATGKQGAMEMAQAYAITINEAKLHDAREAGPRSQSDGNWLKSRYPVQTQQGGNTGGGGN